MRLLKLTKNDIVLTAARHNRRTIAAELGCDGHIDPARTKMNYMLAGAGSPEDVSARARNLMAAVGVTKPRKNAVRAIEFLFSLSPATDLDERAYFVACVDWVAGRFGGRDNILAADVHLDEAAPHCHVLLLPLVGGRMVGSDLVGGPPTFQEHLKSFHDSVASQFGLRRAAPRLRGASKARTAAAVLRALRESNDPAMRSKVWHAVRQAIDQDPREWANALGLEPEDISVGKRMRTMEEIFTSPGKGPKRESERQNHQGFRPVARTEPYAL
jgi:hypothetical protein